MLLISTEERRALRARAHALNPVVSISKNELSDAVLKEIDCALKSHELIKVRVYNDDREQRAAYLEQICTQLNAAPVQHIGKLLVLWRPEEEAAAEKKGPAPNRRPRSEPRRTKRSYQGSQKK
ncbi:MAG: ribosome assembly RNA-binding protein YhbY [Betaproteobacteria bacterium]|nr:ribosome assembly RNA-binding protein YhbY [Betaproteobacteria bacterium]